MGAPAKAIRISKMMNTPLPIATLSRLNRRQMSSQYPRARIASTSPSAPLVSAATAAPRPPAPEETTISCSRRAIRAESTDNRRVGAAKVGGAQRADIRCPPPCQGPFPTVSLTFAPFTSFFPPFGLCASTRPFFLVLERFLVTLPTLQCALRMRAFAFGSVLPTTLGTTQRVASKPATFTGAGRSIVVPSPSWPKWFWPQHSRPPPRVTAQAWYAPPAIPSTPVSRPATPTGLIAAAGGPPQHSTPPTMVSTHVYPLAASTTRTR